VVAVVVAAVVGSGVRRLDGITTVLDWHEFPGPPSGVYVVKAIPFTEQVQRPSLDSRLGSLHHRSALGVVAAWGIRLTLEASYLGTVREHRVSYRRYNRVST